MLTISIRCTFGLALAIFLASPALAQRERPAPRPDTRGVLKSIDVKAGTIVISASPVRDAASGEKTFALGKDVEVAIDQSGGTRGRAVAFREGKLAELTPGTMLSLALSADQKTVESILAETSSVRAVLKSVDAEKVTIKVATRNSRGDDGDMEKTYVLAKEAEIAVDDGLARRTSVKECKLAQLATGCFVTLQLSMDQKTVESVLAEGPSLTANVKSIDAANNAITVLVGAGRGGPEEKTLNLARGAVVSLDDGRGRRFSIKEVKIADVPVGAAVNIRLSSDQNSVTQVRAEGASISGTIKAIDQAKGTITLSTRGARGQDPVEKTLPISKEARILIDGAQAKLADIKPGDEGPFAMLRLSLDQKTVHAITVARGR